MQKTALAVEELKSLVLSEIRKHAGCQDIAEIDLHQIADKRIDSNWRMELGDYAGTERNVANRAVLYVQHSLRRQFNLATDT
jgi:hypothetical protein